MHELRLAQDLFKRILQEAQGKNLKRIKRIVFSLGEASGIEKDFLSHSLVDHLFPGTIAEDAEIAYLDEPVELLCSHCNKILPGDGTFTLCCPHCGSYKLEITKGKDVRIEKILGEESP